MSVQKEREEEEEEEKEDCLSLNVVCKRRGWEEASGGLDRLLSKDVADGQRKASGYVKTCDCLAVVMDSEAGAQRSASVEESRGVH